MEIEIVYNSEGDPETPYQAITPPVNGFRIVTRGFATSEEARADAIRQMEKYRRKLLFRMQPGESTEAFTDRIMNELQERRFFERDDD
jgi:hypothetical protein